MNQKALVAVLFAAGVAVCGCKKEDAKQAGNEAQQAAQNAGAAIDRGLNKLGTAANEGIRDANDAALRARPHVQAASTQATRDLGNMARDAGHLADRAGERIHGVLAPTTQPAR